ncbi:Transposase IS116/IS110/IS902 family protein, partial (plasmid) [Acidiphilium sp. PM]
LLAAIPGVGAITAITMALNVNPANFETGRHFAAWLGLTPREHSTGGKHRMGKISKAGNERLRQLLVVGAMAVIRFAKPGSKSATAWLFAIAGAEAAQGRGDRSGQQDGPDHLGHDGAW